jgi:predicted nucleotidyltransferase
MMGPTTNLKRLKPYCNKTKVKSTKYINKRLEELKPILEEKFQVETIGVFGSYVRGEQTKKSDVDILVEFTNDAHMGLLKYVELEIFLSDQLGVKVDLVAMGGLKPTLKDRILSEVVYV